MKKSLKYFALILALLFVLSGTVMIAYAAPDDGSGGDITYDDGGESGGESGGDITYDDGGESGGESGGDITYDDGSDDGGSVDDGSSYDSGSGDTSYDDTPYYYQDEEPLWYGDASDYDYNSSDDNNRSAGSVSDYADLYDTSGTRKEDVAPNEWSNIALDEKSAASGVSDFSGIKANTSAEDNGQWILYLGYVLIGLAVLGILYFIIATVAQRKTQKREQARAARRAASPSTAYDTIDDSGSEIDLDSFMTTAKRPSTERSGHYADGFDSSYSSRRASKSDTGEIYIPKRAR